MSVADVSWTRPEGWHVTLAFLGSQLPGTVEDVVDALRAPVADVPVVRRPLQVGSSLMLGRAIAFSVRPEPWLVDLHAGVVASLATVGPASGRSPDRDRSPDRGGAARFRPHVTLARTRRSTPDRTAAAVRDRLDQAVGDGIVLPVDVVAVVGSYRGRGPATYHVMGQLPLPGHT